MAQESTQSAFERGEAAGEISARLAGHDKHFDAINGSLDRLATAMEANTLALQQLRQEATARDATVITTARALKDADEARRDKGEQKWSPVAKFATVVGSLAALVAMYVALVHLLPHK